MTEEKPRVLLRQSEVIRRLGISKTSLYEGVQDGRFPKPIKFGERTARWLESEIEEMIDRALADRDREGH
jgi:prophage regulatory protein